MKIVVNDVAASTGGAMTVLRDFYTYVCNHDRENQWIFLLGDQYFEETDNVKIITLPKVKQSRLRKLWFDFVSGRRFINSLAPDAVLSLQNTITLGVKAPQAVYIHQSIPFQSVKNFSFFRHGERSLAVIQHLIGWVIKLSAKKSDMVIVQTKWMQQAVCNMCRLPEEKVLACLPPVKPLPGNEKKAVFDKAAFFYPTAEGSYKNNTCVFQASQMLDQKGIIHSVTVTLNPKHSAGHVACTGRLPYEQVLERYQRATLVFPSYIETFGYPLAEAKMAGAIVLAADTPFAREVLDGYANAYYFDPFKPAELAELMEQVALGVIERKTIIQGDTPLVPGWEMVVDQLLARKAEKE